MKKLVLIAVAASMVTGLSSISRAADEGGAKKDKAARHAELLKKYDKNGDGKLDEQERTAMSKDRQAEIMKKYDKNGDGKLDDTERAAMRDDLKKQRDEAIARRQAEQQKKEGEAPKKEEPKK